MTSSMIPVFRSFRDNSACSRRRAQWRLLLIFTAVKLAVFAALVALIWYLSGRVSAGQFGGAMPTPFVRGITSALEVAILVQLADWGAAVGSLGPLAQATSAAVLTRSLMGAVAARDTNVAHIVTITPASVAPDVAAPNTTPDTQVIGPLAHPMRALALSDGVYLLAALAGLAAICLGLGLSVIGTNSQTFRMPGQLALLQWFNDLSFPLCLVLMGAAGIAWALVARRAASAERRGFTATMDAEGVTFLPEGSTSSLGRERRLRWSEARGFARILFKDEMGRLHESFILSGAHEDFLWEALYAAPNTPSAQFQRDEAWRVAAHRLAEVVAQHTGLPLFDLTPAISTTLTTSAGMPPLIVWRLFDRARAIAKADGDTALARDLARLPNRRWRLGAAPLLGLARRLRKLTPAQRADTLRLARSLMPYYPTFDPLAPGAGRRLLIRGYWVSELTFQLLIVVAAFIPIVLYTSQPFA